MNKIPISLSIVIPVYNAGKHLERTLLLLYDYFNKNEKAFEMVLVDDKSVDDSIPILKRWAAENPNLVIVQNSKNIGQDRSILKGIQSSSGKMVLVIDDDFDYEVDSLDKIFKTMSEGNYDLVYGLPQYPKKDHFRRITSIWSHRIAAWMGFKDATNYKLITGKLLSDARNVTDTAMFNIDKFLLSCRPRIGYFSAPNFPYEHSRFSIYKLLAKFFNFIFYRRK